MKNSKEFLWGVASSAYQVEGGSAQRAENVWDVFCRQPGRVLHGHTGELAIDQYHRYREDVLLMKELGIDVYSFTIAWSRVQPEGRGRYSGFDYYHQLIDCLAEHGICSAITLYHWDHPQSLQDTGGWNQRDMVDRFTEFAEQCFQQLQHEKICLWITMNEPYCAAIEGHLEGIHAPGIRDRGIAYRAIHHLLLAHGRTIQLYRHMGLSPPIGIVNNTISPQAATRRAEDVLAADRAADLRTRMFLDPLLGKGYPARHLAAYPEVKMPIEKGDMECIAAPVDFFGVNYYEESVYAWDKVHPEHFREMPRYQAHTSMQWPIVPEGITRHLRWMAEYTGGTPLYITENGAAFHDSVCENGTRCHDLARINYLRAHIAGVLNAQKEGIDVRGYFVWTLIDNFEWSMGYTQRFGLVYCDYTNLRRLAKDSFFFYRDLINGIEEMNRHE